MAITDSYASEGDYTKRFTNRTGGDNTRITRALEDATDWITSRTHQFFTKDAAAVARIWEGDGSPCLKVYGGDNCPGIADIAGMTVKLDSGLDGTFATTYTAAQYELHPLNALFGRQPGPYKEIVIPFWSTASYLYWPKPLRGGYRVQVTAIYGWPSVPASIRDGCVELAGILLGDSNLATRTYTDLGQVMAASSDARIMVANMIDIYREAIFA